MVTATLPSDPLSWHSAFLHLILSLPALKSPHCVPSPAAFSANFPALPVCPPPLPPTPQICALFQTTFYFTP